MKNLVFMLFLVASFFVTASSQAQESEGPKVKLDVAIEHEQIVPGESSTLAYTQNIIPHWHTYWKNAGDSGEPMRINWQDVPEGIEIGEMLWPVPEEVIYDPLVNFGYHGRATILAPITISEDFNEKGEITLNGKADWLVCQEICIPEFQDISLSFVVGEELSVNQDHEVLFEMARNSLPKQAEWRAEYADNNGDLELTVYNPDLKIDQLFVEDWGLIHYAANSEIISQDTRVTIRHEGAHSGIRDIEQFAFVIVEESGNAYRLTAENKTEAMGSLETGAAELPSLVIILGLALIGGIILNLMPCVFPVLSMKALHLAQSNTHESSDHALKSGLAYTAGVILSFLILAAIMLSLRASGAAIGWGFQLQDPLIVGSLALLIFFIGLNLSGVFEIRLPFMNAGSGLAGQDGLVGSFFTGVLATLVATPCTAPFMAVAIGASLLLPTVMALLVFAVLGFGLALPFLLISLSPQIRAKLPKPGTWMVTFKQFLAFPMYATALWLIWVLGSQGGTDAVVVTLIVGLAGVFLIWVLRTSWKIWVKILIALVVALFLAWQFLMMPSSKESELEILAYSPDTIEEALDSNAPVFIEMTADWCITCQVNKKLVLDKPDVIQSFLDHEVTYIRGDWTNRDSNITKFLNSYGRNGVPIYVYYEGVDANSDRGEPVILPQVLTQEKVINLIQN